MRAALGVVPQPIRFAAYRQMVDCDPAPDSRLVLKIAETQDELEACFSLLHDAYVASGFMKPHPSGLRVTPYHALPTTTTLCAKFDGKVAGTLSIVREGVFGFPLQSAFDLSAVRAREGRIAEISALAIHPAFRRTGGSILFPLMKFMYEYCTQYFDTRHLVIAVHPTRIELYEALLAFERLQAAVVDEYDFANGAPAVGATLDLQTAPRRFHALYADRNERHNLYRYFVETRLANIQHPDRRYFTSNDPVLTPALLDHFFNRRTDTLAGFDDRKLEQLHSVYPGEAWKKVLPPLPVGATGQALRQYPRFSVKCPATLSFDDRGRPRQVEATLIELSLKGFQARTAEPLRPGLNCSVDVALAEGEHARIEAVLQRKVPSASGNFQGFRVTEADPAWIRCVNMLWISETHADLAQGWTSGRPLRPVDEAA
ncbi:MAG: GNAT family N-acetyltransferase [Burkholderiales bacterium]|nr:GNAT family N-acetyltransferase [Burkholderiales bacterium]MDE2398645.1 GNAT family N-acetyltransferase [Burkholderiales bacterium]